MDENAKGLIFFWLWLIWTEKLYYTFKQKPRRADILTWKTSTGLLAESQNHNSKSAIDKTNDLNERNFLISVLYKDCYWLL